MLRSRHHTPPPAILLDLARVWPPTESGGRLSHGLCLPCRTVLRPSRSLPAVAPCDGRRRPRGGRRASPAELAAPTGRPTLLGLAPRVQAWDPREAPIT